MLSLLLRTRFILLHYNITKKSIELAALLFFEYIDVTVTIHHTDTVSVAISCSCKPIVVDIKDILQLSEALIRTELHLSIAESSSKSENSYSNNVTIPRYTKWIVKMWHFGIDTIDEYGKEFKSVLNSNRTYTNIVL